MTKKPRRYWVGWDWKQLASDVAEDIFDEINDLLETVDLRILSDECCSIHEDGNPYDEDTEEKKFNKWEESKDNCGCAFDNFREYTLEKINKESGR